MEQEKSYVGKHNLLKFKNACVISVKGKTETKKGVFIPIEDNHLFVSADMDTNKAKGVYIDFFAWANKEPGKFGDTHMFVQSLPKDVREKMSEQELKQLPIFGNMKPFEQSNAASSVDAAAPSLVEDDMDLPF